MKVYQVNATGVFKVRRVKVFDFVCDNYETLDEAVYNLELLILQGYKGSIYVKEVPVVIDD